MNVGDNALIGVLVFVAALLQVTLVASLDVAGGSADLLLLVLVALGLLRGAVAGAVAGFFGGLLVDVVTLDTLGVAALLYALVGYWAGRYGETTGRGRPNAPLLAVLAGTVGVVVVGYAFHFLLGETISARRAFVDAFLPALALNLLLGRPVFALVRRLLARTESPHRATEVRLLG